MKPGIKTTEFWLSLTAILLGALTTSGLLGEGSTAARIAGLAVTVLAALGYTAARSKTKSGGFAALDALLVLFCVSCVAIGCATSLRDKARTTAEQATIVANHAKAAVDELCDATSRSCASRLKGQCAGLTGAKLDECVHAGCTELEHCQARQAKGDAAIVALRAAVLATLTAIDATQPGHDERLSGAVVALIRVYGRLVVALQPLGLQLPTIGGP